MKEDENSLKYFFEPKSIAIVGASNNPDKVGNSLMKNLEKYNGEIIPINPKYKKIMNKISYSSIKDYPKKIDLVIIATPAKTIPCILEECGKKSIKNIIVISAGFSEQGNSKLEKEIVEISKKYKINLLGPNCFGIANPYLNLDTTFSRTSAQKGNIAFISQSGALWSYISDYSLDNFGFSGFVSLGNMAGLEFSDFIEYFDKDKKTKTIILYVEKLKNGKRFIEVCKKSKKDIIAVKAGKSEKGSKAAISHTGSLATDFEIYKGAFKQARVKIADCLLSALDFSRMEIKPKGKKVVIITNAGGAGALETDACFENKLKIVNLPKEFQTGNPIDLLGTALAKDYEKILKKLEKENFYDSVIVILTPQKMSEPEKTAKAIVNFSKKKPIIACFLGGKSLEKSRKILNKGNVLCFNKIGDAANVLEVAS